MADISAPTIPIGLQQLFEDAGFLAAAEDDQKPCIKGKYYVQSDSWLGYLQRRWDREGPDKTKVYVRRVCEQLSQSLNMYVDTNFYDIILIKMVKVRIGVERIANTYRHVDITVHGHLLDSILILDMKIPESVKQEQGFGTMKKQKKPTLPLPAEDGSSKPSKKRETKRKELTTSEESTSQKNNATPPPKSTSKEVAPSPKLETKSTSKEGGASGEKPSDTLPTVASSASIRSDGEESEQAADENENGVPDEFVVEKEE